MTKRIDSHDLETWEQIADAMGIHEVTAKAAAERKEDPLPVYVDGAGRTVADSEEIREWLFRIRVPWAQRRRTRAGQ